MKTKHVKLECTANEDGNAFYDVYIDGKHVKKIEYNLDDGGGTTELHRTLLEENISTQDYLSLGGCLMKELSSAEPKDNKISVTIEKVLPIKHNSYVLTYNFLKTDDNNAILKIILHNECCCLPLKCSWDGVWELTDKFNLFEKLQTFTNKIRVKHYWLIRCLVEAINKFNEHKGEFFCYSSEASILDMCNLR